jgi:transketolase
MLPELVGGSAVLAESTCTEFAGRPIDRSDYSGSHIHFGVREHAMAAILNGLTLHGGFRAVGSTFLVFSDYSRPAVRLAALMAQPVVHVFTHDSIGLGEDGPTHQPIEHLAALRAIPTLAVIRPADGNEVIDAWRCALDRRSAPTALVLSRQALPTLAPATSPDWIARFGARVVTSGGDAVAVLVATGSEVATALSASQALAALGIEAMVVSMPWRERFFALPSHERAAILPPGVPVVVVEAGIDQGWHRLDDLAATVCIDAFGASGKGADVQAAFGFTPEAVAEVVAAVRRAELSGVGR